MKFKYSVASSLNAPILDSRGKIVKRPVLWLKLKGKNGDIIEVPAVIDSGADTTTVNIQYADYLGTAFAEDKQKEIMGIGKGRVPVKQCLFPFTIKEMGKVIKVPAWYVDSENVNILLGREVFFDKFKIKFEQDHETFELTESAKK